MAKSNPRSPDAAAWVAGSLHKHACMQCRERAAYIKSCLDSSSSSSNWILLCCQPHRVTSGQPNSGHKQTHISQLFSYYISTLCQVNLQNQSLCKHKTSDTNFRRVSPFNITPVKRAHKARTCWYHQPFRLIYRYQGKEQ